MMVSVPARYLSLIFLLGFSGYSNGIRQASAAEQLVGEKLFRMQCATCHSAAAGEANRQGPNLYGVLGRTAGTAPLMVYSASFKQALAGKVWDEAQLDKWLEDPQAIAPETIMMYQQSDPEQRQAIIGYLKTLHPP